MHSGKSPDSQPNVQEEQIPAARRITPLFGLVRSAFVRLIYLFSLLVSLLVVVGYAILLLLTLYLIGIIASSLLSDLFESRYLLFGKTQTIVLALGEDVSSVLKHSTFDFKTREIMDEETLSNNRTPFVLEYRDSDTPRLVFPPGRFFVANTVDGVIVNVNMSPQLDLLGLDEAIALCRELMIRFEAAKWVRDHTYASDMPLEVVKQRMLKDESSNRDVGETITIGDWHKGNSEAYLNLERNHQNGYLLTLNFSNSSLYRYRSDEVLRKRKADSLPLEEPRVIRRF